jgi:hypothetical protein
MAKRVAIVQSNYIPWKGYFDMINMVDEFILFDDVQYTKQDWRNRNQIKTANGTIWLTVPVESKGRLDRSIFDTQVEYRLNWPKKHWASIEQSYARSPFLLEYGKPFREFYMNLSESRLSLINRRLIEMINEIMDITTRISFSNEYELVEGKNERLISIIKQVGGSHYLSGPAAKSYLDEGMFKDHGISVTWMDYSGYPEYPQLHPPFRHDVSILDLIFNTGPEARNYMKSFHSK